MFVDGKRVRDFERIQIIFMLYNVTKIDVMRDTFLIRIGEKGEMDARVLKLYFFWLICARTAYENCKVEVDRLIK